MSKSRWNRVPSDKGRRGRLLPVPPRPRVGKDESCPEQIVRWRHDLAGRPRTTDFEGGTKEVESSKCSQRVGIGWGFI